jgi:uncharacterized protein (TIGR02246 family)
MTRAARAAVHALGDAFEARNTAGVLALFATDGDIVYAGSESGEVAVGVSAMRMLLEQLFTRDERYTWRCDADAVHVLVVPAGAVVVAEATLFVSPEAGPIESFPYRVSGLLEKEGAVWRWRYCHGSEPATPLQA